MPKNVAYVKQARKFADLPDSKMEIKKMAYFEIVSRSSSKCIDVPSGSLEDGANIQQFTRNGGHNQNWQLQQAEDGWYYITARHSGKVIDVPFSSSDDGVGLIQHGKNGGKNQQWRFVPVGDRDYHIINRNSQKLIDVQGNGTGDNVLIVQHHDNGQNNQIWSFYILVNDTDTTGTRVDLNEQKIIVG